MSNLLTQSRMRMYRDCPYKHDLSYNQKWRPVQTGFPLRFGSLIHEGLEVYWRGIMDGIPVPEAVLSARQHVVARGDAFDLDGYETAKALSMIAAYTERWSLEDRMLEPVLVEESFDVPLIHPRDGADHPTWRIGGKFDGLVRDKSDGSLWILEHKTTSTNLRGGDASPYFTRLVMDPQVGQYIMGALALGYEVRGVLYDVLHKPLLKPYKKTPDENMRYKKNGEPFANMRLKDESPTAYRQRISSKITSEPAAYFHRRRVVLTDADMASFAEMTYAWADLMSNDRYARLRNPGACEKYGSRCTFWDHCANGFQLEDHPNIWRVAERTHEEL